MRKLLSLILIFALALGIIYAQSLEERLQRMAEKNAKSYINPFVTAFGTAMNSGWFFTAKPHKTLGFDIGIRVMAVEIPDDQKVFNFDVSDLDITQTISIGGQTYSVTLDPEVIYPERDVPTVFGESQSGQINPAPASDIVDMIEQQLLAQGVSQTILSQPAVQQQLYSVANSILPIQTPPGFGLKAMPMAVPQAAVGLKVPVLPIHLEVAGRYLPEVELPEDMGKFKFYGLGGKLALDPLIPLPLLGIKISAGAYAQKLEVGKIIESNHMIYTLQVSRDFNLLILGIGVYGGVGKESSDFKFKYTYNNASNPNDPLNGTLIKFNLKGENDFRYTVGARVRLLLFNVNADYSQGTDRVATVGVGITIR